MQRRQRLARGRGGGEGPGCGLAPLEAARSHNLQVLSDLMDVRHPRVGGHRLRGARREERKRFPPLTSDVWGPTDDIHLSNGSADGNDIEYMKNYNIWHKAQVCIFYSIEHTSYIFLWHTGIFLDNIWSTANTTSRNNKSRHAHVHTFPLFLFLL
jgi:hypothetical protein